MCVLCFRLLTSDKLSTVLDQVLAMRKRIKVTGFSDWDSMFYNNLLCIPILTVCSIVLEDWGTDNLNRNLYVQCTI
jgi:hypothetical protein